MFKKVISYILAGLIAILPISAAASGEVNAQQSGWNVFVDGELTALQGYNIGGTNYYKLRDIAMAVNGSAKQFNVTWNAEKNEIYMTSKTPYTPLGGELSGTQDGNKSAVATKSPIYFDGKLVEYTAYYINGNNYFRLRDILKTFDIGLNWKAEDKTVHINTGLEYTDEEDTAGAQDAIKQVVIVRKLDEERNTIAEGLGFMLSSDGKIATSFHAVRGAEVVTVSFPGEAEQDIEGIIAWDVKKNIAVIKSKLKTDTPLVVRDGAVSDKEDVITFENTGRHTVEEVAGKAVAEGDGKVLLSDIKLNANSIGTPVIDKSGKVIGMAHSQVYGGRDVLSIISAKDIYALNLNAEPKSPLEFRRLLYMVAGDVEGRMLSNMLYTAIDPMHFDLNIPYADKDVDIVGLRAEIADEKAHELYIKIMIAENDDAGYSFREHSQTQQGEKRIVEHLEKMLDVLFTYMPEYEVRGEILCGHLEIIERDENGNVTQYEFHPNEDGDEYIEDVLGKVSFGYASEYNGWMFEIE